MKKFRYAIGLLTFCLLFSNTATNAYAYGREVDAHSLGEREITEDDGDEESDSEETNEESAFSEEDNVDIQGDVSNDSIVVSGDIQKDARNGILQVQLVYVDDNNERHIVSSGTGFLIGTEEEAKYVITSYTTAFASEELRNEVANTYGVGSDKMKDMTFELQIAVKRDVVVSATVETSSAELGFAALSLSKEIFDRTPLCLDSDLEVVVEMEEVYTLGFPNAIQGEQDVALLTYEDVSVMNGIISKKTMIDGRWVIQHSAIVTDGNVGGPLVDLNGNVIGVNQIISEDGYNYSVHISEITSILDALGIPYMSVDHTVIEEVDKTSLIVAIDRANSIDLKGYTKESVEQYHAMIAEAQLVVDTEDVTKEQIDEALSIISSANTVLVVKSNLKLYLIFGGVVLAFIVIIIILIAIMLNRKISDDEDDTEDEKIIVKKSRKKKNTRKASKAKKGKDEEPKPYEKIFDNVKNTSVVDNETSVLNSAMGFNDGETTVLSVAPSAIVATLIRCKSNESVQINKDQFYVGKDGLKSDFCVKGNPSISRTHALIKRVDNVFYIEDLKATNGTYHNDVKLQPSQSIKLSNGDRIKMADEEFIFRV